MNHQPLEPEVAQALNDIAACRHDKEVLKRLLAANPGDERSLSLVLGALIDANREREALHLAAELLRAHPTDRHLSSAVKSLRHRLHWSVLPLWPMRRWGWSASIVMWIAMLIALFLLHRAAPQYAMPIALCWILFSLYSWIWPPLLQRLLDRDDA